MSGTLLRASLLGLVMIGATSLPAAAFKKVNLGTRSKDYIQGLCTQVQGQYLEGQGQYGCMTNCGGKAQASDACGINCSEQTNECYGWSPRRPPRTPIGVLHPPRSSVRSGSK